MNFILKNRTKHIGIQFYGNLTRNGFISLISIDADKYVYLLDIEAIKDEDKANEVEIINLLSDILSDSSIIKVRFLQELISIN